MAVKIIADECSTKFGPKLKYPVYVVEDGSTDFINRLTKYVLDVEENIIAKEGLVSDVPKNDADPYQHTQQWKQHNLLRDFAGLDGEHLERFPHDPVMDELFSFIRMHYLTFLAEMKYPRIKAYVHAWANVLRGDQFISRHSHITGPEAYLAATYYLTTNNTSLYFENPINMTAAGVATVAKRVVMFPSWLVHFSDKCEEGKMRISLAFDIVTENTMIANPWRPHVLLDDPATMPGLEG